MGTRSLTFVYEKYGQIQKPVVNMYRQFDGYPTGHGDRGEFEDDCVVCESVLAKLKLQAERRNSQGVL